MPIYDKPQGLMNDYDETEKEKQAKDSKERQTQFLRFGLAWPNHST